MSTSLIAMKYEKVLSLEWEQKALEQFPPFLGYFYTQRQNGWPAGTVSISALNRSYTIISKTISKYCIRKVVTEKNAKHATDELEFLCILLRISPQATAAWCKAFHDIIQDKKIDLTDPSLRFDQAVEQQNKDALIARMPRMMCDIYTSFQDTYGVRDIMSTLYRNEPITDISKMLSSLHSRIGKYISPQTLGRLVKNFNAVTQHKPVYFDFAYTHNQYIEEENNRRIFKTFPEPIQKWCSSGYELRTNSQYLLHYRYFAFGPKQEGDSTVVDFTDTVITDVRSHIKVLLDCSQREAIELSKKFSGGSCTSPQIERMKEFFLCVPRQHNLPLELSYKIFGFVNRLPIVV